MLGPIGSIPIPGGQWMMMVQLQALFQNSNNCLLSTVAGQNGSRPNQFQPQAANLGQPATSFAWLFIPNQPTKGCYIHPSQPGQLPCLDGPTDVPWTGPVPVHARIRASEHARWPRSDRARRGCVTGERCAEKGEWPNEKERERQLPFGTCQRCG